MDSSLLFSSIYSSIGAARELLRLALQGEVRLILSQDVLTETGETWVERFLISWAK